jgi:hypothetical protein
LLYLQLVAARREEAGGRIAEPGLLSRTRDHIEERLERERRALEPRRQLRSLVDRVDDAIFACEEAHLGHLEEVTDDLAARARDVYRQAWTVLAHTGDNTTLAVDVAGPTPERIDQLMDRLWAIQESTFNALLPWRRRLAEEEP